MFTWVLNLWLMTSLGGDAGVQVDKAYGRLVLPTLEACEATARSVDALPVGVQNDVLLTGPCEERAE